MATTVPFTAFCPECRAGRTFTVIGFQGNIGSEPAIGCCVCGTSERDALIALSGHQDDDRATIGEIAARVNALDSDVQDLRDETHDRITALADRLRRHQDNHLHAVLRDGQRIEGDSAA